MNILPKKSWHVRTKANIERVRKDEEKAAQEEKDRQRRIALAEQEARTELLRKRAQNRSLTDGASATSSEQEVGNDDPYTRTSKTEELSLTAPGSRHINFFNNIEESARLAGNKEFEAEQKEEKEKHEKAIGLLTYLGQSAVEAQTSKPWYLKSRDKSDDQPKPSEKSRKSIFDEEFDAKTKSKLDPMNDMVKYLEKKRKSSGVSDNYSDFGVKKKKHTHTEKKSGGPSGPKTIEQLRAERLRREQEERLKQERLLARVRGEKLPEDNPEPVDDRSRRYNQQYNPDLARKPKPKDYEDYREHRN